MGLIKTSILNAIAVIIKMLTLLGINKILAIYVGPAGYAALGQFQNAVQMITTFASGAVNTGVVKYTAEYHADPDKQIAVWRTAGTITIYGSLFSALLIAILNKPLAQWFLQDQSYGSVFLWFSATLVFFTLNTLLLAILNGKKDVVKYVIANILGSIFTLIITTVMAVKFGIYGALVSLAIYQSLAFFVTLIICLKAPWFRIGNLYGKVDKKVAINLAKYTAMAVTSAVCVPLTQIFIRNHIGQTLGWESAGYWEAMWRLSSAYLLFFTTVLGVYYLPRISEITDFKELKKEIWAGYKLIFPLTVFSGLLVYLLRDWIIVFLFSKDFLPMSSLFAWQMVGDSLKIASWLLAYIMLGRAYVKLFIVSEIFFSLFFCFMVFNFTSYFKLEAASIAYAINYLFYFIFIFISLFNIKYKGFEYE
ncbi:O-antigen translocase [Pseudomonas sp. F1_0610]|uniref:O-antigen translocase n=1 Tax=Pseudomonas sp. F1_0610 TaxID=3114284 RepID=UPI0039C39E9A